MKKIYLFIIISLLILTGSCSFILPEGTISIVSVTPNTGLTDNTLTAFTIELEYTLNNTTQGEIMVGFNTGDTVNNYSMAVAAIVNEGSGTYTYNVSETTKDWGIEGDFTVGADIVSYNSYSSLGSDLYILTF